MGPPMNATIRSSLLLAATLACALNLHAQPRQGPQGPQVVSPEVGSDRKVSFRIVAPKAESVRLGGGDIPGLGREGATLTKNADGVWEVTVGPVEPGSYRYRFDVDGVAVVDPRNPLTSESNANTWSLAHVPGADFMDVKDVPHGAVASVTYHSKTLGRFRRMHVYTPPGYEKGSERYPVFYLLHGASDSDASWSTVGRAGVILDNLIAEGKARPMIVVMPAGHTGPFRFGGRFNDEFEREFSADIQPFVEARYRVREGRENRAIAGLSMGGAQTLNIAIPRLGDFAHIGVFSSGVFGIRGGFGGNNQGPTFEERHAKILDDAKLKEGLKLFWFATGKDDFLLDTSRGTVEMFKKHGFDVVYNETEGAHTWMVWREYLRDFASQLFR
jgi:enterochelin esterase-like enzyme